MNTANKSRTVKKFDVRKMTVIGILSAISIIMSLTPIGYIPINPVMSLTIMHIPVIIGAIVEGPLVGMIIGFVFGMTSLLKALTSPSVTNFISLNPLVSVIPRMLIGLVSYYAYVFISNIMDKMVSKKSDKDIKSSKFKISPAAITGIIGTLTNTVGYLGMAYILYGQRFADAYISNNPDASGFSPAYILFGLVGANAIPEAILAAIIVGAVATVLKTVKK